MATRRIVTTALLVLILCGILPSRSISETIRIPITLDYSFLRSTFIQQAFTKPGEKAVPLSVGEGCTLIELWDPQVGPQESLLKLTSNIRVQAGLPLLGRCMKLSGWEGQIEVLQRVLMDEAKGRIGFEPSGFRTFDTGQRQRSLDKSLVDLLQTHLNPYLGKLAFDARGAVKGLSGLLPLFFSGPDLSAIAPALAGLRPGAVQVTPQGLSLDLLMDVDRRDMPREPTEGPLTGAEAENLTGTWQDWDVFLVRQLKALGAKPVAENDKDALMEQLLDSRYNFVQGLSDGTLTRDFVTGQFTGTWENIGSLLRKYLAPSMARPADYLAFFGTSDFLTGLAKAGLGISPTISSPGLDGLTKALLGTPDPPPDHYSYAVDNNLRSFLGLERLPDLSDPPYEGLEIDFPDDQATGGWKRLLVDLRRYALSLSHAAEQTPAAKDLDPWVLRKGNLEPYLGRIKVALEEVSGNVMEASRLAPRYRPLYQQLVYATAWQESCWRQFIGSGGKLRPIVSYNQTSVGLMQINERVWRGIYKTGSLRWDARYNIRAGCEILDLYLRKYALRKPEGRSLDDDSLARAVYAMYNGGPGQLKKFIARKAANNFLKVDRLFWEKYSSVKNGDLNKVSTCY